MTFNLEAQKRTPSKKSDLTNLRAKGGIPAVIYGKSLASTPICVDGQVFLNYYKKSFTELAFYEIELEGKKHHCILKDKLVHPVSRQFLHLDFFVVEEGAEMEFEIPIQFEGEAAGEKEGGFVDILQRTVKITCKPKDLPRDLILEISDLHVGDSLQVKDLPQGKWSYKDSEDQPLVVVHAKRAESADEAEGDEAAPEAGEEASE
ncbi:MAG: 50S ribosomal protein L25 [Candidatus Cloacimonetes bacterium]|nr:50S ribosomal protein L25 [Candidatus Cloacimonadota bacterium]